MTNSLICYEWWFVFSIAMGNVTLLVRKRADSNELIDWVELNASFCSISAILWRSSTE